MSNTIAHLMIAQTVLAAVPTLSGYHHAFFLGSLAPDTIGSKPGCTRDDKKRVHLREGIRDADWLNEDKMQLFDARVHRFVREHIQNPSLSAEQKDFNTGYLVHLLTDKWNHKTIRQTMLKIANDRGVQETDREFFYMMTNDLEALDHYLLTSQPQIKELFTDTVCTPVQHSLPGYIEAAYIESSIQWWQNHYLPGIQRRSLLYITEHDIDDFVTTAAAEISKEIHGLLLTE